MAKVHELLLKIRSSFDGKFGENVQKITKGFQSVEKQTVQLQNSQEKLKNLQVQVKGYEKVQNQILGTKLKSEALTEQISQFKESLNGVEQGSNKYNEIEKSIKSLEKEQLKATIQTQKFEQQSKIVSNQLKNEGISTDKLSSEKEKLIIKTKDLKEKMDKLTNSQKKNESQTKDNNSIFGKLTGSMKGIAIGMAGAFGLSQIKQYGVEAIALANEKIKAETDLQAMLKNTKKLHGDMSAINKGTEMLKDYANQLETVGVIGDETTIAGEAQLATFQLMPSSIKTITTGMVDMLAKNKGMNATQEDATAIGNLLGKVMNGNVGALSKYGVIMTDAQKKTLKMGTETQKAALLAKVLKENFGGANEALGKTDEGKMVIMRAEIEGMKEDFGKGLLPLQRQFFEIFKGQGPNISKVLGDALNVAGKFFNLFKTSNPDFLFNGLFKGGKLAVGIIGKGIDGISSFVNWMKRGSDGAVVFGGVITGIATAVGIYTTAVKIHYGWTKLVAGAQFLWNTAANLNPIGIVLSALIGLGIGLVYAYKHSEKFRNIVNKLWGKMKDFGSYVMSLPEKIKGVWDGFIDKTQVLWEKIKKLIEPLKTAAEWVGKLFSGGDKNITLTTNNKNTKDGTLPPPKKFAIGGIVNKPTFAEIGEGGDTEVVIPLNNSSRSKGLLDYAFNAINGNKKSPFDSGSLNIKNGSTTQVNNDSPIQVIVQVTVQGIADTIEKAKQIGSAAGSAAAESFEKKYNEMKRNKRRLSLG